MNNTTNLTNASFHGIKWSYISSFSTSVFQIGLTAIMARLLEPTAFGLVAMAGVVLRFGSHFSQMGVGQALIQKSELRDEEIRAAFTSSCILGLLFFAAFWCIAPFAVYIFNESSLVPILRFMAATFIITGLSSTALSLLRRNLKFKEIAVIEITSYVFGYGTIGVILALSGFGVWSLVIAAVGQATASALLSYLSYRHSIKFITNWRYYKDLYSYGSRISTISFLEFIGFSLDTLIIGRYLGPAAMGIYNRAYIISYLPLYKITTSLSRVLFASFSRIQSDIKRLKKSYMSTTLLTSVVVIPVSLAIFASAKEVVLVILGYNWIDSVVILKILSLSIPLRMLSNFGGIVCDVTARLNIKLIFQTLYIFLLISLFFYFFHYGLIGFGLALFIAEFIKFIGYTILMNHMLKIGIVQIISNYRTAIINGIIVFMFLFIMTKVLNEYNMDFWGIFLVQFVLTSFLFLLLTIFFPSKQLKSEIVFRLSNVKLNSYSGILATNLLLWYQK
jgi:lipopolysaccharide exporter